MFDAQQKIEWRLMLDGCLSVEWAECQQRYLTWIGSRKSGKKWVAGLIYKLWEIEWDAWMDRNSVIHDTPLAEERMGSLLMDKALEWEWTVGFDSFPAIVRVILPEDISLVLKGELDERKGWLVLVRRTRENVGDDRTVDEFSDVTGPMRKWVGI